MLKNEPTLAIGGVDTAENEPSKVGGFLTGVGGVMMLGLSASCHVH